MNASNAASPVVPAQGMGIASCYVDGYEAARKVNPELADAYIRYTQVGDPLADAVVEELSRDGKPASVHRIIGRALDDNPPDDTPQSLLNLVADARVVPDWYDRELAHKGTRAFLRNSDLVLGGLVAGAIIEGFSTLISKSFRIRGRIQDNGVRRLKQNLLQLVEQFIPGGLEPGGDGWRLSLRIRLVHAQVRMLIKDSSEWDEETFGLPLSTAHMLLGAAAFSARLMQHVTALGGDFNDEEREAYIHVWRYTGLTMGIPESILFTDYASAMECFEIATMCEPPPDDDAIIMANSIVNSAPIVLGFTEPGERRAKAAHLYRIARELIGDELANGLRYPRSRWRRSVPFIRLRKLGDRAVSKFLPGWRARLAFGKFDQMLDVSNLGSYEPSYKLPTAIYDEDSREW